MRPGDTFFIPTPDNPTRHLWIVLTEVTPDGRGYCVNVTSMGDHIADTADSDEENHSFRAEENYFIAQRRR